MLRASCSTPATWATWRSRRLEYYRNLGILLYDPSVAAYFDSATVKATLEFKSPAHLDDMLDIFTRVVRIGTSSIVMDSEIFRHGSDELLTRAEMVYVDYDSSRRAARPVPDDVRRLINHFEETGEVLPLEGFPSAETR